MIDMTMTPAITGTRALGTLLTGSWLTCEAPSAYLRPVQAPNHLQFAGVVPAPAASPSIGNAVVGADAARKRGRPPRGIPR